MEMANEFPDANIVGVDMSPVFPSTIIPSNCRFVRQDIIQGLPFPDNYFDFVHQRLLVAGLTPENWVNVIKELERVTKPGGWIELAEVDGKGDSAGPCTSKIWDWIDKALLTRGVDVFIGKDERLKRMVEEANIVNVNQYVIPLPTGEHGGKVGKLLLDNVLSFYSAVTPIVIHGAGVDKEEYEEAVRISQKEVEEYKSYHVFFIITGQKRGSVETENNTI
ncbi:hypothetical protein BGZ49_005799 [Haplosporangium sp. Z 27]|nr:hypothetical protein BGZ49_005799 [Haplosporangium sp. Z 27]